MNSVAVEGRAGGERGPKIASRLAAPWRHRVHPSRLKGTLYCVACSRELWLALVVAWAFRAHLPVCCVPLVSLPPPRPRLETTVVLAGPKRSGEGYQGLPPLIPRPSSTMCDRRAAGRSWPPAHDSRGPWFSAVGGVRRLSLHYKREAREISTVPLASLQYRASRFITRCLYGASRFIAIPSSTARPPTLCNRIARAMDFGCGQCMVPLISPPHPPHFTPSS